MALTGLQPDHLATYAAASGTAAVLNGFCSDQLAVEYQGEELFYQWNSSTGEMLITAAPAYVFTGSYYYEEGHPSPEEQE
jgi:diaminopimelate epimerase